MVGTLFEEVDSSITKHKAKSYHFLSIGVITSFFGMAVYLASGTYKLYFTDIRLYLNPESIPMLSVRVVLEILQSYFTILAIKHCDRSTYSVIRILTIPLLVVADSLLGYAFSPYSILGMSIMLGVFLFFGMKWKTMDFK